MYNVHIDFQFFDKHSETYKRSVGFLYYIFDRGWLLFKFLKCMVVFFLLQSCQKIISAFHNREQKQCMNLGKYKIKFIYMFQFLLDLHFWVFLLKLHFLSISQYRVYLWWGIHFLINIHVVWNIAEHTVNQPRWILLYQCHTSAFLYN